MKFQEIGRLKVTGLTSRERQILDLILDGHSSKSIAADLGISQRTVEVHRATIMKKIGTKNFAALITHGALRPILSEGPQGLLRVSKQNCWRQRSSAESTASSPNAVRSAGIGLQGESAVRPGGQPDAARVVASEGSKALARFTGGKAGSLQIAPARGYPEDQFD